MTTELAFVGAKLALIKEGQVLTYLRDAREGLAFPAHWDFPGGGREGDESAEDCVLRELHEEFGLILPPDRLIWRRDYLSDHLGGQRVAFFGGRITDAEIAAIVFGDEGQFWEMMAIDAFLAHDRAITHLQNRLRDFLGTAP
ncbi:MAG: NUDIX hydrolase [Albidovulum sp.]|uniref:NUDIX hydrolase n=1 Tax=Albidovulum sp. TaxID=1872424 RepID=UPI003C9D2EC6